MVGRRSPSAWHLLARSQEALGNSWPRVVTIGHELGSNDWILTGVWIVIGVGGDRAARRTQRMPLGLTFLGLDAGSKKRARPLIALRGGHFIVEVTQRCVERQLGLGLKRQLRRHASCLSALFWVKTF